MINGLETYSTLMNYEDGKAIQALGKCLSGESLVVIDAKELKAFEEYYYIIMTRWR